MILDPDGRRLDHDDDPDFVDVDIDDGDSADAWLDDVLAGRRSVSDPIHASSGSGSVLVDAGVSPGLRQLLDEATPVASPGLRDLVANSVAPSTREAYERDWADFDLWCHLHGVADPLTASSVAVGEYLNELVRDRKAISTINRRLAAIGFCQHVATGRKVTDDPLIIAARAGAKRLLAGQGTTQAAPLRLGDVRTIVTGLPIVAPNRPTMRRDQLIVALGWASALRSSELVGLDVDDLNVVGDLDAGDGGLLIRVRAGKGTTDVDYVAVPFSSQWTSCPVRRAIQYIKPLKAGPVFRHIDRHGRAHGRLTARSVTDVVRRCVVECLQIDAAGYTSHSLRAGFVTEARANGVPDELIARHTRHGRPGSRRAGILDVYDRPTDRFERPALNPDWW